MGFVKKLQEATDVDCSYLYPVSSKTDSGRLLQLSVRKTLISKGRILRKEWVFFPLSLQESIMSERFWHLGKVSNGWKIANMPGRDEDVGKYRLGRLER